MSSQDSDLDMQIKCQYTDISEFNIAKQNSLKSFSLLHLNTASLVCHFDDLSSMLSLLNLDFDVIGISETRIKEDSPPVTNIDMPNYFFLSNPTSSSAGGTGLYISNNLAYKPRPDLCIHKSKELESTFIEIINNNSPNSIVACIYRHPCMQLEEFNTDYVEPLLEKLSLEQNKKIYIMGDFNVDLMKVDDHNQSSTFLELFESNNLIPQILLPTRITSRSKTLIDNIFTNNIDPNNYSGNLECAISDHLPQFLITADNNKQLPKDHNIFIRDIKKLNQENFIHDLQNINWDNSLNIESGDVDQSVSNLLKTYNIVLDRHAPLKKASKKDLELRQKPWITKGIQCSIRKRDIIFGQFKKCTSQMRKNNLQMKYKTYRNKISTLIRISKKNHMANFFEINKKNSRKIWQGIRSLIKNRDCLKNSPSCLVTNNKTLTDPIDIANCFNSFFANVGKKIQNGVYSNHVHFSQYMNNPSDENFFTLPTHPEEISDLISSFSNNKASGPNSIPNNILQLTRDIIAYPLALVVNLSFETGKFPQPMKRAKIIPIHKKGSKLDVDNYRPISLLSNLNQIFEKLMYKRLYKYLTIKNKFYDKQFGFRKNHSTSHALFSLTETIRNPLITTTLFVEFSSILKKLSIR